MINISVYIKNSYLFTNHCLSLNIEPPFSLSQVMDIFINCMRIVWRAKNIIENRRM